MVKFNLKTKRNEDILVNAGVGNKCRFYISNISFHKNVQAELAAAFFGAAFLPFLAPFFAAFFGAAFFFVTAFLGALAGFLGVAFFFVMQLLKSFTITRTDFSSVT